MTLAAEPPDWHADAACAGSPLQPVFVGDVTDPRMVDQARAVCRRCPVWGDCDRYARSSPPKNLAGVYAGRSDADRQAAVRQRSDRPVGRPRKDVAA